MAYVEHFLFILGERIQLPFSRFFEETLNKVFPPNIPKFKVLKVPPSNSRTFKAYRVFKVHLQPCGPTWLEQIFEIYISEIAKNAFKWFTIV